jgi:tRNA (guanosine-2'-O-)-methyltransferase
VGQAPGRTLQRGVRRDVPEVSVLRELPPLPASAAAIVEVLAPLVTPARLARIDAIARRRTRSLVPVLEDLADPHNGAAILRSADAFGCHEVHVIESRHPFAVSRHVSRRTERWIELVRHGNAADCAAALKARGYEIFVAEMGGALTPEELAARPRAAIVLGNEHFGASSTMRAHADGTYAIPMAGMVESLNVSVASAITLYVAARHRQGDLDEDERNVIRARLLLGQVKDAEQIVRDRLRGGV